MAIGRNFLEALQKACQSQENNRSGLGADKKEWIRTEDILNRLEHASDDRLFRVKDALRLGVPERTVHKLTKIDPLLFESSPLNPFLNCLNSAWFALVLREGFNLNV